MVYYLSNFFTGVLSTLRELERYLRRQGTDLEEYYENPFDYESVELCHMYITIKDDSVAAIKVGIE